MNCFFLNIFPRYLLPRYRRDLAKMSTRYFQDADEIFQDIDEIFLFYKWTHRSAFAPSPSKTRPRRGVIPYHPCDTGVLPYHPRDMVVLSYHPCDTVALSYHPCDTVVLSYHPCDNGRVILSPVWYRVKLTPVWYCVILSPVWCGAILPPAWHGSAILSPPGDTSYTYSACKPVKTRNTMIWCEHIGTINIPV